MAWMKSIKTGKFYLTGEFTSRSDVPQKEASGISKVLGFSAAPASGDEIKQELARVAVNRAQLLADIGGGSAVDVAAIVAAVEAQFAAIPGNVVDELTERLNG